jgi:hypothetical protein
MNIRSVGPALCLAARASTKDGRFDLVCVDDRDRSALTKYLDARVAGQKTTFPLPIWRFRQLKVIFKKSTIHLDDRFWPRKKQQPKGRSEIAISVKPSALSILHGDKKSDGSRLPPLISVGPRGAYRPPC